MICSVRSKESSNWQRVLEIATRTKITRSRKVFQNGYGEEERKNRRNEEKESVYAVDV